MAAEPPSALSPPLPPDPAPAAPKVETAQPPLVSQQQQQTSPATPLRDQEGLKRVDSSRSASLSESPILQQRQPIKDAVNYAANNVFEHSPVTNQLDPEFIRQLTSQVTAQVTEQVLQNLQAAGATPTPSAPQTHFPPPPPPAQSSQEPRSPALSSFESFGSRYTPPTPDRMRDSRDERGYNSSSPEPVPSDAGSNFSRHSVSSTASRASYRNAETPRPSYSDTKDKTRGSGYTSRRLSGTGTSRSQDNDSVETARERSRRDSRSSEVSQDGAPRSRARPARVPSDVEETTLEKIWQPLFDHGNPTMRLGQFLRGLALHLIDDYEPKNSIVITPAKMLRFLNETKIEEELYPWDIIFGEKLSPNSISAIYQKLLCQHHFIQERHDRPPTIPGLTPWGFDQFMTCLIQAHPQSEYERIAKAVVNMPISNADNKTERFPKELSRRLFPNEPNIQAQQRLISSLNHEPYTLSLVKGASAMPPPPPPPSAPPSSYPERERKPYSQSSSQSNAVDDDDLAIPSVPIERERKPYTAKEGAGKVYGDDNSRPPPTNYKPEPPPNGTRTARTNSGVPSQAMYNNSGPSDPMNIPRNPPRMQSGQNSTPQPNNGGFPKPSRRSPPPRRDPYVRSDPDFVGSIPNNQFGSNLHPTQSREQNTGEADDDAKKRYRSRSRVDRNSASTANQADEDPRGYPIPGRSVPIANGYEYGSGPGRGPPIGDQAGGIPVGSYPTRRPTLGASGFEDRRRSMYNPPTTGYGAGDGGTDGYGSFANTMNGGYQQPPSQSYGSSAQH